MIITNEDKKPIYELSYACTKKDQKGILVFVSTDEQPHTKGYPHAHLQEMNEKPICIFFITEETPLKKHHLRFVKETFDSPIPSVFKQKLIDWAKESKNEHGNNWEYLKERWANLYSSGVSPTPFQKIKDIEIVG